ncbi:MAG: thioredoxin family protein [Candidatus Hydrothermae bacterium]|nr:thioredoxin family protein [Candidatus Hydrothermae bacterium]
MLRIGDPMPTFSLPGVDDHTYSPEDFRDSEILVVIFSCNHCPYVKAYEDRMIQIAKDYADRGVQFVLINANDPEQYPDDSFENMKIRAREKGYPFPYLFDASQDVPRAFGAGRTPEVFVFDRDRRLRYRGAIDDAWDDPGAVKRAYLRETLDALLRGQEPPVTETPAVGCTIKWRRSG